MSVPQLARNTAVSTVTYVVGSVAGLVLVPILLKTLGPVQFGLYVLAQTTLTYSSLLGGGLNRGFVRSIAAHSAVGDDRGPRIVVGTGLLLMGLMGGAIVALLALTYPLLAGAFRVAPDLAAGFRWVLLGASVAYAFNLLSLPYQGLLIAAERLDVAKTIEGVAILAGSVATAIAALAGRGLPGIALVMAVVAASTFLITGVAAFIAAPSAARTLPRVDTGVLAELWHYGSRIQLVALAGMVNRSIDRVSLGILASPASVAVYDVGDRGAFSIVYTANTLADALAPRMVRHLASSDMESARATYGKATIAFALPACILGSFAALHGPSLIRAWLGSPQPISAGALVILAAGYAVGVSLSAANVLATAEAVPTLATRFSIAQAAVNIVLSFGGAAIGGVLGAAVGSALSGGIGAVVYSLLAERHILGSTRALGVRSTLRALAVALPCAALVAIPTEWAMSALAPTRLLAFAVLGIALLAQVALTLPAALHSGLLPRAQLHAALGLLRTRSSTETASSEQEPRSDRVAENR